MTRLLMLGSILALYGCDTQVTNGMDVVFYNQCPYPVFVNANFYTDASEDRMLEKYLNVNENERVFTYDAFTKNADDLKFVIPDEYSLTISANGREHSLNKAQFLQEIHKAKYVHSGSIHTWTISDSSLCP